jgi:hypothetical protein
MPAGTSLIGGGLTTLVLPPPRAADKRNTLSEIPTFTRFQTTVRLKSGGILPTRPASLQALLQETFYKNWRVHIRILVSGDVMGEPPQLQGQTREEQVMG